MLTITGAETDALKTLAARSMTLICTCQDGHVWLASPTVTIELAPAYRIRGAAA